MQGKIISLFDKSSSYGFHYHNFKRNARYSLLNDQFSPIILPAANSDQKSRIQDLVIALIRKTGEEMQLLREEDGSFLNKFEQLLRILYRFNCFNPELIVQYQEISIEVSKVRENRVLSEFHKLVTLANDLLKDQAHRDGFMEEGNTMDQLVLFMMGEVLKLYQADLVSCCRKVVEEDCEFSFPSEEEIVNRYYQPIAEQLKGLIAS